MDNPTPAYTTDGREPDMAITLNTPELLFLKALVEDRIEKLDGDLDELGTKRRHFSEIYDTDTPTSEEELSVLIVRQTHANILRRIEQELDVPFPAVSAWNVQ